MAKNRDEAPRPLSPPFVLDRDDVDRLYERVQRLAEFLEYHRAASNKFVGRRDCIPRSCAVVSLEQHRRLSVVRLYGLATQLRKLRATWDSIVRTHEDDEESDRSKRDRHAFLHLINEVLNRAYLSEEQLEAREEGDCQQLPSALKGSLGTLFEDLGRRMQKDAEHNEEDDPDD